MPFSIWEYLRERTRDAVLAGFQDALDVAEQGDTNGRQHAAATRFRDRLGAPGATQLPTPSVNGEARAEELPREHTRVVEQALVADAVEKAPAGSAEHPSFDDELESRLDDAASPQNGRQRPYNAPQPGDPPRRRRGRPRKDEG